MSEPRAGSDLALALRQRRRARMARHLGLLTVLFGGLTAVGIIAGGAALGRWDLPYVEDPVAAAAPSATPSYSGPMTPECGLDGTIEFAAAQGVQVTVLNGTGREGLATALAGELAARGFTIARIGDTQLAAQVTNVRYPPDLLAQALTVAANVGTVDIAVNVARETVTVTIGSDFASAVPVEQAAATLATPLVGCVGVPAVPAVPPLEAVPSVSPAA